jgi:hypothetical protein
MDERFRQPVTVCRTAAMIEKVWLMVAKRNSHFQTFEDYAISIDESQKSISCCKAGERSLGFRVQGYCSLVFFALFLAFFVYSSIILATQKEILGLLFTVPMALMSIVFGTIFFDVFFGQWVTGRWKLDFSTGSPVLVRGFVLRRNLCSPISLIVSRKQVRYGDQVAYIEVQVASRRPIPFGPLFGSQKVYQLHSDLSEAILKLESPSI